ncbi:hypothetical protein [Solirhodobacter olei]|uniref:hypothetical protein n=1 Tax=Solirhodobacter olei TaxID=2493082 RepID=UPI0013E2A3E2|nr:hypothetical protein [Solirhodobacter olei]
MPRQPRPEGRPLRPADSALARLRDELLALAAILPPAEAGQAPLPARAAAREAA